MKDPIERQAAIDAFLTELTKRERKNLLHTWSTVEVKCFVADMLEKMPSAQPEPCEDAVSRQAAIDALDCINGVEEVLRSLPPVQPERKRGKWLADNRPGGGFWVCSCCKFPSEAFAANVLYKFCPNCGADMRGEQDG